MNYKFAQMKIVTLANRFLFVVSINLFTFIEICLRHMFKYNLKV